MADTFGPPAKRPRLDNGASHLDVPGSPIDDMDDDFYETTPVKPTALPIDTGDSLLSDPDAAPTSTGLSSLSIPGLGLLSNPQSSPITRTLSQGVVAPHDEDPDLEDGELSDSAAFYNHVETPDPKPVDQPHVNGASQHNDGLEAEPLAIKTEHVESLPQPAPPSTTGQTDAETVATSCEASKQGEDAKGEFLRAAEANKGNKDAEWELDSQASDSSSASSGSDDSSDGEVESEDGELLDPEEQIRRLLMESTDDPGTAAKASVKTQNEVAEQFEKPNISLTAHTVITELGKVESTVDNMVLIKANVSGDYQVLESGSALCLGDRTVIGKVAETMGRVHEPRYSIGFSDPAEIANLGITKDVPIFYVNEHSTFVMTEPLRNMKFTDASNLHDEEAIDVEFSDDEKEAEYKKRLKEAKKAKAEANRDSQFKLEPAARENTPPAPQSSHYQGGGLNYSDDDEDLGMYKPLTRPDHFEDIVGAGAPIEDRSHVRRGNMRGGRGGWMDRGRGHRGRGGGGGGGRRGNQANQFPRGQPDRRGRQPDHGRQWANPQQQQQQQQRENRSASAASPNRQSQGRSQPQHSPPRGKSKKRKNRHHSPAARASQPPASTNANANAYAHNNAPTNSSWPKPDPSLNVLQPPTSYAPPNPYATATSYAPTNPYLPTPPTNPYAPANAPAAPAIPAGSYINPAFYTQATQAQNQQAQQANLAQWAQWIQVATALQQSHSQPQPQPQPNPAPSAPQADPQAGGQSLQGILRALSGAQGR